MRGTDLQLHATNYWVDVVFTPTLQDAIPPVISSITATTVDSSKVKGSWLTNEDTKRRMTTAPIRTS